MTAALSIGPVGVKQIKPNERTGGAALVGEVLAAGRSPSWRRCRCNLRHRRSVDRATESGDQKAPLGGEGAALRPPAGSDRRGEVQAFRRVPQGTWPDRPHGAGRGPPARAVVQCSRNRHRPKWRTLAAFPNRRTDRLFTRTPSRPGPTPDSARAGAVPPDAGP
jgi:hypothetical protein